MATIYRELDLDADADEAWRRMADVKAVNKLIDFLGAVTIDGDRRSCALGEQGELNELIVTVDNDRRRLVYSIRESPFNFAHHSASWQVTPDGDRSRLVWITDLKPDSVAPEFEKVIDQAADSIQRNLSRA
jgi:carbon monoxide dehydrogenase subunit G